MNADAIESMDNNVVANLSDTVAARKTAVVERYQRTQLVEV